MSTRYQMLHDKIDFSFTTNVSYEHGHAITDTGSEGLTVTYNKSTVTIPPHGEALVVEGRTVEAAYGLALMLWVMVEGRKTYTIQNFTVTEEYGLAYLGESHEETERFVKIFNRLWRSRFMF